MLHLLCVDWLARGGGRGGASLFRGARAHERAVARTGTAEPAVATSVGLSGNAGRNVDGHRSVACDFVERQTVSGIASAKARHARATNGFWDRVREQARHTRARVQLAQNRARLVPGLRSLANLERSLASFRPGARLPCHYANTYLPVYLSTDLPTYTTLHNTTRHDATLHT